MKRFIKNNIIGFIIGIVLCGGIGIGVYASTISSSIVTYTKSDNTSTTVEEALNYFYDNFDIIRNNSIELLYYVNFGTTTQSRKYVTWDVIKGDYYLFVTISGGTNYYSTDSLAGTGYEVVTTTPTPPNENYSRAYILKATEDSMYISYYATFTSLQPSVLIHLN